MLPLKRFVLNYCKTLKTHRHGKKNGHIFRNLRFFKSNWIPFKTKLNLTIWP